MRADRLIALVLLLQNEGKKTAQDLAESLEVSRRTILRDLEALSVSGVPVWTEGGRGGGISLDEAYRTSLTGLKEAEVRALLASTDGRLLADLGWGEAYKTSQWKLQASVPRRFEASVAFVKDRLLIDSRWWWHEQGADPSLEVLQRAVFSDAVVEAEYEHFDGTRKQAVLEAYALVAKAGLWYFIGRRDGEYRTYRVSRFFDVRMRPGAFRRDPGFDLSTWWPAHTGRFAQEFSAYRFVVALPETQVRYLRGIAPGRVDVRGPHAPCPGWVEAEVSLDSSLYAELVVLGLGRECRLLEPPELATAVLERARAALEAHGGL